ncbi:MAG: ureidoglycolate lyase [Alphaproteobacteria bacterium]|nr:ureidoglycolate lyase [Alphaproteobacteria bacterium]
MQKIALAPLTAVAAAGFGDVIEIGDGPFKLINEGLCRRYTDLAALDISDGALGISLFQAELRSLPYTLTMMERHPLGSQCFIPQGSSEYLVIVAEDADGVPGVPKAFHARGHQSFNLHRNIWHGVLAPIAGSGLFAVVDRIGPGANLQEHWFDAPYIVG